MIKWAMKRAQIVCFFLAFYLLSNHSFYLQVTMLAPFILTLVKVAMSNMMGQMVILYLMDVLYSYSLRTVVEESSSDKSSWSVDERCRCRMEHLQEQHLAGNYHTENHSPTPLLGFPMSLDEDEDDESWISMKTITRRPKIVRVLRRKSSDPQG